MKFLARLKNQLLARLATAFPSLGQRLVAGYQPRQSTGRIPFVRPVKPLSVAKLALVTTSGIHHASQPPFDMNDKEGDPSYRVLDGSCLFADFKVTHDYYDHSDAEKDPNIIFPLDPLKELATAGVLGRLSSTHYSFMGHIDGRHIKTLIEKTAREVALKLQAEEVDVVLLTPA